MPSTVAERESSSLKRKAKKAVAAGALVAGVGLAGGAIYEIVHTNSEINKAVAPINQRLGLSCPSTEEVDSERHFLNQNGSEAGSDPTTVSLLQHAENVVKTHNACQVVRSPIEHQYRTGGYDAEVATLFVTGVVVGGGGIIFAAASANEMHKSLPWL